MKILILCCGNLGATKKAGEILAMSINGSGHQIDCISKINKEIDYSFYDAVVFGTNVRMGKFNKEFKNQLYLWKNSNSKARAYCFIVGARAEKTIFYEKKAGKLINNGYCTFVGGELNAENAGKFDSAVINSIIKTLNKKGSPLPRINQDKLRVLADVIIEEYKRNNN
ncbi:MAG: hypothetical protein IJZ29_03685 [Clostridia bacterium]|nr:hypothetical protein [Clostridia bacterium]